MFKCETCNYESETKKSFVQHKCKGKTDFQCNHCLKYYLNKKSLTKHKLICKKATTNNLSYEELQKQNEELKEQLKMASVTNINNNSNNNNTIIDNTIIDNSKNLTINIVLPHKKTTIDHLTDADYFNILGRYLNSIPLMIEKIHFNEDVPENHNIYIPNIKNKFAMLYNGSEWSLHNRDEIIDNLITDNEMRLEDWLSREDIQEKYPTAFKRF